PIAVSHCTNGKYQGGYHRRPEQLLTHPGNGRSARVGTGCNGACLLLTANTPGKNRKKHCPPEDEIDRNRGGQRQNADSLVGPGLRVNLNNRLILCESIACTLAVVDVAIWQQAGVAREKD